VDPRRRHHRQVGVAAGIVGNGKEVRISKLASTAGQVSDFERDGFLVVLERFTPAEIGAPVPALAKDWNCWFGSREGIAVPSSRGHGTTFDTVIRRWRSPHL
jgi:hypothetical protein